MTEFVAQNNNTDDNTGKVLKWSKENSGEVIG